MPSPEEFQNQYSYSRTDIANLISDLPNDFAREPFLSFGAGHGPYRSSALEQGGNESLPTIDPRLLWLNEQQDGIVPFDRCDAPIFSLDAPPMDAGSNEDEVLPNTSDPERFNKETQAIGQISQCADNAPDPYSISDGRFAAAEPPFNLRDRVIEVNECRHDHATNQPFPENIGESNGTRGMQSSFRKPLVVRPRGRPTKDPSGKTQKLIKSEKALEKRVLRGGRRPNALSHYTASNLANTTYASVQMQSTMPAPFTVNGLNNGFDVNNGFRSDTFAQCADLDNSYQRQTINSPTQDVWNRHFEEASTLYSPSYPYPYPNHALPLGEVSQRQTSSTAQTLDLNCASQGFDAFPASHMPAFSYEYPSSSSSSTLPEDIVGNSSPEDHPTSYPEEPEWRSSESFGSQ